MKLVNIPSIANIVINKIKQQLIKKLVLPAMDDWPLPHIPKTEVYLTHDVQHYYVPVFK